MSNDLLNTPLTPATTTISQQARLLHSTSKLNNDIDDYGYIDNYNRNSTPTTTTATKPMTTGCEKCGKLIQLCRCGSLAPNQQQLPSIHIEQEGGGNSGDLASIKKLSLTTNDKFPPLRSRF